jgi:putative flippase GtrA
MRYAFFGALSTAIDLSIFYVLIQSFNMRFKPAITIAFLVGVLAHYLFVQAWVYTGPFYGNKTARYINFLLVNTIGLILTITFFRLMIKGFHPHTKSMVFLIRVFVSLLVGIFSYLINTIHVFKQR